MACCWEYGVPLKAESDHLVSKGILVKITPDEPSDWLNSFVCVKKPNWKICLCLDPTQLNKYVIRLRHNARLVDAMLPKLAGAKHFTIIDCMSSFFMLRLTYNSSLLTAFGNIYWRYRYERMPMGASPSSGIPSSNIGSYFHSRRISLHVQHHKWYCYWWLQQWKWSWQESTACPQDCPPWRHGVQPRQVCVSL